MSRMFCKHGERKYRQEWNREIYKIEKDLDENEIRKDWEVLPKSGWNSSHKIVPNEDPKSNGKDLEEILRINNSSWGFEKMSRGR